MNKQCIKCNKSKEAIEFYPNQNTCKDCYKWKQKLYYSLRWRELNWYNLEWKVKRIPWNKWIKTWLIPNSAFKKWQAPWNKWIKDNTKYKESEHNRIAKEILWRSKIWWEEVHHINRIKDDNRKRNIIVCPSLKCHRMIHNLKLTTKKQCKLFIEWYNNEGK